jgi:serine/threonine-protein kinase HipA
VRQKETLHSREVYTFPELPLRSFHGLPGLLADALPDKFGNALIDAWLAAQGRIPESFSVIGLCYMGTRGMGALEFRPASGPRKQKSEAVAIDALVELASTILSQRDSLHTVFDQAALADILAVGTSAGGARAKAVIAWNPRTSEVRSGQVAAGEGFEYWLLKFDGVENNKDKELADPKGYGAVEYAYSLMAKAAGITMSECRLWEENDRCHFMTRRFDRLPGGGKLHMQSLAALAHFDFNDPRAYSYEQAFLTIRQLGLPATASEEQFRRMAFNIIARNQDDHVKNIAFLMNRQGIWSLSPAFDITWSYNPNGQWTAQHQMAMNGKRDGFARADFDICAKSAGLKPAKATLILDEVKAAVSQWHHFADEADIGPIWREAIAQSLRLYI